MRLQIALIANNVKTYTKVSSSRGITGISSQLDVHFKKSVEAIVKNLRLASGN